MKPTWPCYGVLSPAISKLPRAQPRTVREGEILAQRRQGAEKKRLEEGAFENRGVRYCEGKHSQMTLRLSWRNWVLILAGVVAWMGVLLLFVDTIPPTALTKSHMTVLNRRFIEFTREHRRLPESLEAVPIPSGYANPNRDGWKEPILFSYDTNGVVTLRSFGSDKRPGGEGHAADIECSFPSKDTNGNWYLTEMPPITESWRKKRTLE